MNLLLEAISYSSVLALASVGLSLCIITTRVSNFAHADYVVVGAYAALLFKALSGLHPYLSLPLAALAGGVAALLSYLLVFEPLRGRSIVTLMIASMALDLIIRSALQLFADHVQSFLGIFARGFVFRDITVQLGGLKLELLAVAAPLTSLFLLALLYFLLFKTRIGIRMRAVAENAELAEVLGVNVERTLSFSWFVSGALAGAAGVFLPLRFSVSPDSGSFILLTLFAAVILGGLGSLTGTLVASCLVGFTETLLVYGLSGLGVSTALRPLFAFSVIILTLLLQPRGLAGLWAAERRGVLPWVWRRR
uniref:Branched-chain amino acid ABC transporter permease n=1 Tax=Thermofilum pendens TaxID=2269 RepID=A0A7C1T126_THEPE